MDQLGRESIRLDQFYVSPVCAPTRASLLTGKYHLNTGTTSVTRRREVMKPEEVTMAEICRENGYATGFFGKWHNGSFYPETPDGQGFEETFGFNYGHITRYFDPVLDHNGEEKQYNGYITDILTEAAINFMDQKRQTDEPFFCYIAYNAPHTPALVPDRHFEKFKKMGLGDRDSAIYGMVDNLDENIGRIMQQLEDWNLAEDTLVIFMTDNGPVPDRYNAGMKGRKGHYDEGGVRVPFFMRWPGKLKAGAVVDQRLAHIDVLPTLADFLGLSGTESLDMDGISFRKLLIDAHPDWPDRILYTFPFGNLGNFGNVGAARTERWLSVRRRGQWFLYDLLEDPRQTTDLALKYPWVLDTLTSNYESQYSEIASRVDFDQAPIPFGYDKAPTVTIEAHDAILVNRDQGGIDYNFPAGYAHHWITRWTNPATYPEWPLDCKQTGEYNISLQYCLNAGDEGVELLVVIGDQELRTRIDEVFEPESIPQPFRLKGEASKYESKPWKLHQVGKMTLPQGVYKARVRLMKVSGKQAIELKGVRISKL